MKLSRREEIAIDILVACARSGFEQIRTEDAAIAAEASPVQTAQVVHRLMRVGLLDTTRGRHGGIRLRRGPELITLGDVLRLAGGKARGTAQAARRNDPLAAIASAAEAQAAQTFESFTIADLAADRVGERLTCFECSIRLRAVRRLVGAGDEDQVGRGDGLARPQPPQQALLSA
jgi:Rrf2 family protein